MKSLTFRALAHISALTLAFAARPAAAHFALQEPACYSEMDFLGSPQKSAPCGQDDPGQPVVATGKVTAYQEGQTISITINEIIPHPGHYRVSIAKDLASLPADPAVTAGSSACGSTIIEKNPQLPLLGDGLLVHTTAFSGPQTMKVQIPPGFTCDSCVLQVSEFMSSHPLNNPGGCFYHHCANVTVTGTTSADAGSSDTSEADAGTFDTTVEVDTVAGADATADTATLDASQTADMASPADTEQTADTAATADATADAGGLLVDAQGDVALATSGGTSTAKGCDAGTTPTSGWAGAALCVCTVLWTRRKHAYVTRR